MTIYNLTNISGSRNIFDIFKGVDQALLGKYSIAIVIAIFMISYVSLKNYSGKVAITTAFYITTILALILKTMNMGHDMILYILVIGTVICTAYLYISN